jgi:hypothetical protein
MKVIVRLLIALLLVLVISVVVVGPGRLVAGAEYPFGVGPWGMNGRYCQDMYSLSHLINEGHQSDRGVFTPEEKTTFVSLTNTLTKSGPAAPRADFAAFFEGRGNAMKRASRETTLLNTWWNQNCTAMFMEAPSSLNHAWSGLLGHANLAHYPRNVMNLETFFRVSA